MTSPAIAPYVPNYASFTPYITRAEFLQSATGVDTSQLVPKGTQAQNNSALDTVIARASSEADIICRKTLCATADVQVGVYRVTRDGQIRVPVDYTPLIEVTAVKVGYQADQLQALTSLSGLWIQRKTVRIPVGTVQGTLPSISGLMSGAGSGRMFAQVSYVNGWANTTLAAPAIAGATSVTVTSGLGIFPGLVMPIYDADVTEFNVAVASTYVQGSTTVPLVAPLANGHAAGVAISALPPFVKQAVVNLTSWLIKTRGATAMVINNINGGGPGKQQKSDSGGNADYDAAEKALKTLRRAA